LNRLPLPLRERVEERGLQQKIGGQDVRRASY